MLLAHVLIMYNNIIDYRKHLLMEHRSIQVMLVWLRMV